MRSFDRNSCSVFFLILAFSPNSQGSIDMIDLYNNILYFKSSNFKKIIYTPIILHTNMHKAHIIIIGSGIAGLYAAYNIKKISPNTSFLILEKNNKKLIGGRAHNDLFHGTEIVTGAGIGRKKKDKLLYNLLNELDIETNEFTFKPYYSNMFEPISVKNTIDYLKHKFEKYKGPRNTFRQFAKNILGDKHYRQFLLSVGNTDFENEDVYDTLYSYGMDDNYCCFKAFRVPWRLLTAKLEKIIGKQHFRFSTNVSHIDKIQYNGVQKFIIDSDNGNQYLCDKIIVATTITSIRTLLRYPIYKDIEGQPFLRLYGKFSKQSIPIMKEYVKGYTCMPGPLQKIIPINPDNGIYMISYNDNKNTLTLKNNLKNTKENRLLYCKLLEISLGIPKNSLHITTIKDYYWSIGTHYYKPLNLSIYKDRSDFINIAQHPENGILVVGEVVSKNQGWVEGALKSTKVLTKKWITSPQ